MNLLTVVLLCYNRPLFAREAIKSILNQSEKNFNFIISDNSTNNELKDLVKSEFPSLEYLSWFPGIPAFEHFKNVISLVNTKYFVLFHDDDTMESEFVENILNQFKLTPNVAAVGTNGFLMTSTGQNMGGKCYFTSCNRIDSFSDKRNFLMRYLVGDLGGVSPFCSYAYNAELIRGLYPDYSRARNYCDAVFLADVLERGAIIWLNQPLVRVRCHDENLSFASGVSDYKGFLNLIRTEFGLVFKKRYIDEYRLPHLIVAMQRKGRKLPLPVIKYFICAFPGLIFCSSSFRKRILKKILRLVS
jgi:glycosyltransferase involved in cell wall biosynthesis